MTREEAKEILERGGSVYYHSWTFTATFMNCGDWDDEYGYCCSDNYDNVEQVLDSIHMYCSGKWDEVEAL